LFRSTVASAPNLALSLLFIPYAQPGGLVRPILFVGWSLNYELFFYALFAAGLAFRRYGQGLLFVTAALVALTGAGLLLAPSEPVPVFYTSPLLLEFVLGMAVAAWTRARPCPRSRFAPALFGIGFACALLVTCFSYLAVRDANPLLAIGIPAAAALYCAVMLEKLGYGLRLPLARRLGDASYTLYLSHPFIVGLAAISFRKLGGGAPLAGAMIPATLVAAGAAALALHAAVERPLTGWLRRRVGRSPAAAVTSGATGAMPAG
jgi:exopolysaccharide production protein ExoZ